MQNNECHSYQYDNIVATGKLSYYHMNFFSSVTAFLINYISRVDTVEHF